MSSNITCNSLFTSTILIALAFVISIAALCVVFLWHKNVFIHHRISLLGFLFVLVGGGHNIYEKLVFGCVKDNLSFFNLLNFNVWDILVITGLFIIGINVVKYSSEVIEGEND